MWRINKIYKTCQQKFKMNGRISQCTCTRTLFVSFRYETRVQFSKQKQPLARLSAVCTLDPCLYHALFTRRSAGVHVNTFVNISTDFPYRWDVGCCCCRCRRRAYWLAQHIRSHSISFTHSYTRNNVYMASK